MLAAYRPTGKGRVERMVDVTRDHVLAGRSFRTLQEADAAFMAWVPIRRGQVHRTTGQHIGVQAVDDACALRPLPAHPYVVTEVHVRRVAKDCLLSFEGSHYSVPARQVRAGQRVEVRPTATQVTIRERPSDGGQELASHARAARSGSWVVDESHWDGLPDGHTRAVTTIVADLEAARDKRRHRPDAPPAHVARALAIEVGVRPLSAYATAAGMEGTR